VYDYSNWLNVCESPGGRREAARSRCGKRTGSGGSRKWVPGFLQLGPRDPVGGSGGTTIGSPGSANMIGCRSLEQGRRGSGSSGSPRNGFSIVEPQDQSNSFITLCLAVHL
jgi:hypothetical protein